MTATVLIPKITAAESRHAEEWIVGSKIDKDLTDKCLRSIDGNDSIAKLLGWKAYRGDPGWRANSIRLESGLLTDRGQFKPDTPLVFPDGSEQKYVSFPKGLPNDAHLLPITLDIWLTVCQRWGVAEPTDNEIDENRADFGFWVWLQGRSKIPIFPAEGIKKSAKLLSEGLPSPCLAGVEGWHTKGNLELVANLAPFCVEGRTVYPTFDADIITNKNVRVALKKFAKQLTKQGCNTLIPTWDIEDGKGVDDLMVKCGPETFDKSIEQAMTIEKLEKQFKAMAVADDKPKFDDQPKKDKPPIASKMAGEIAEEYRDRLAYDDKSGRWLEYDLDKQGMWTAVSKEYVLSAIAAILESKGYSFSNGYVNDVFGLLRNKLLIRKWEERSAKDFLPFENGVLEIATGKLLPHAPGYRFTWQLPRQHNVLARNWDNISQFLDEATGGNKALRDILICYANASLKGRSDLQKFLFLKGCGGTGKGTLMRLLSALIGETNIHSSTLEDFCGNQFESANAYQKRGVFFWDEDRKVGRLGKLKALTGGDWIRGEEKGMKAFQFRFDGMVVIAANFPIFAGDSSSGLSRRIITVPMNQRPAKRKNLEQLFEGELDAFTNYLLSLDDDFVTRVLLGEETVPAVKYEYWDNRQRTDSIAAWLNDWTIANPDSETPVGNRKDEAASQYEATTLYGSYCLYCHQNGFSAKSSKNFSPDLLELCTSILGWQVSKTHTKTGKYIRGLRLRSPQDLEIPTYDFVLLQRTQMTGDGSGDGSVTGRVTGRVTGQDAQPKSVTKNLPPLVTDKSELGEEKKLEPNSSEAKKNISSSSDDPNLTRHLSTEISQVPSQQEAQPVTPLVTQPITDPSPDPSPNPAPSTGEDLGAIERVQNPGWKGVKGQLVETMPEMPYLPDWLQQRWEELRGMTLVVDGEPWRQNCETNDWQVYVNTYRGDKRIGCVSIPCSWFKPLPAEAAS